MDFGEKGWDDIDDDFDGFLPRRLEQLWRNLKTRIYDDFDETLGVEGGVILIHFDSRLWDNFGAMWSNFGEF